MIWNASPSKSFETRDPYHAWIIDDVLDPVAYAGLVSSFPVHLARPYDYPGGLKWNCNRTHPDLMEFINSHPLWREFFHTVAKQFPAPSLDFKFEFSFLPTGGGLTPHTDTVRKAQTAVFYFPRTDWNAEWGGEFEILRDPKNRSFTQKDLIPWEGLEVVRKAEYVPNRAVFMERSDRSLHGVRPVSCPSGTFRQSVTVAWLTRV